MEEVMGDLFWEQVIKRLQRPPCGCFLTWLHTLSLLSLSRSLSLITLSDDSHFTSHPIERPAWGRTEDCWQQPMSELRSRYSGPFMEWQTAWLKCHERCWARFTQPIFLTVRKCVWQIPDLQKMCVTKNVCCFKLPNLGVICYSATHN